MVKYALLEWAITFCIYSAHYPEGEARRCPMVVQSSVHVCWSLPFTASNFLTHFYNSLACFSKNCCSTFWNVLQCHSMPSSRIWKSSASGLPWTISLLWCRRMHSTSSRSLRWRASLQRLLYMEHSSTDKESVENINVRGSVQIPPMLCKP